MSKTKQYTKILMLRITPAEDKLIRKAAKKLGSEISPFVRATMAAACAKALRK